MFFNQRFGVVVTVETADLRGRDLSMRAPGAVLVDNIEHHEAGFDTLPFLSHLLVLLAGDLISGRLLSLVGLPLTVLFFAARLFFLRLLTPGALPVFAILVVVRWKGHVRSLKRASSGEQLSENPAALGLGFSRSRCRWPHLSILRFARQTQRFEARGLHPAMQGFGIDDAHRGKMRCVSLR